MLATPRHQAPRPAARKAARWRMPWVTAGITLLALIGALVILYPSTAAWFSQYNQSLIVESLDAVVENGPPSRLVREVERAREYNEALVGGGILDAGSNVPTSDHAAPGGFEYDDLLRADNAGAMGRLRIGVIDVDLPIYHGTSDEVLGRGVGHLEGTSLPVGGDSQHSVLTAHRGLPEATMFDNLHKVKIGDTFTIETFGRVLTYRAISTQTVLPDETQSLLPEYGQDLVTLVTCTPLGINTHRYLVTGERITPTPDHDIEIAGTAPTIPGFPWWTIFLTGILGAFVTIIMVSGRRHAVRADAAQLPIQSPDLGR